MIPHKSFAFIAYLWKEIHILALIILQLNTKKVQNYEQFGKLVSKNHFFEQLNHRAMIEHLNQSKNLFGTLGILCDQILNPQISNFPHKRQN